MPAFNGGEVGDDQAVYMVYCDIYRNGRPMALRARMLPELVIMEKDDPCLEDKLFALADESLRKHFEHRIAEDCIIDPVACGEVVKGGAVQFEFTEPTYETRIFELYDSFMFEEVSHYLWYSYSPEDRAKTLREHSPALVDPVESEYHPVVRKVSLEETLRKLKEFGLDFLEE